MNLTLNDFPVSTSSIVWHFPDGTTGPGRWDSKAGEVVPDVPSDATPVDPDSDDGTYEEPTEETHEDVEPAKTDVPGQDEPA